MIGNIKLQTSGNFDPIPSGKYTLQLSDGEMVTSTFKGVESEKIKFTFLVLNDNKFKDSEGKMQSTRGRKLWQRFSTYMTPKSFLTAFVKVLDPGVIGLSEKERANYDLDSLMGRQIDALVAKEPSKDGLTIYNNITAFEACETLMEPYEIAKEAKTEKSSQSIAGEVDSALEAEKIFGGKAK